ncbi:hypothetical protein DITRI_Ditri02bG0035600 [Diplodiscus trichospermus]
MLQSYFLDRTGPFPFGLAVPSARPPRPKFATEPLTVFTARNEKVDLLKPDATVIFRNAEIDMFKGSMRLAVDKCCIEMIMIQKKDKENARYC